MINNEVLDCIRSRRSTRKFKEQQIKEEELKALLEAATWAPSGGNNQSWLFTAIQNKETLLRINELLRQGFKRWVPDDDYPGKLGVKAVAEKKDCHFFYHAPTLIIASNKPNYENAMADCSLALENLFLAANSIGLGTCYINQLHWLRNDAEFREFLFELGIPKEHTICSSAVVGYIDKPSIALSRNEGTINIIK
ncbi:nitroreductase family protein [Clostridium estertheticum]|uniref:nitroreductase family protein n=1 Tax=Clostridium estertheticum TaxID=238834 RepID=UPI001C7DB769|nr:nitroreductase family protein [Clostridium estertheticum]MBX4271321.1 nitroreductase [Clostridium estertheticum]WLC78265.1 nitroreductase [Clostridium estertheticum]